LGCLLITNEIILIFSNDVSRLNATKFDVSRLDATKFDVSRLDATKLLLNDE
jgi:hypothetical protein